MEWKPVVAVNADRIVGRSGREHTVLDGVFAAAIGRAGATPIILPPILGSIEAMLDIVDAVVLVDGPMPTVGTTGTFSIHPWDGYSIRIASNLTEHSSERFPTAGFRFSRLGVPCTCSMC